jgi:hypothetical protein
MVDGRVRLAQKGEEGTDTETRWEVVASSVRLIPFVCWYETLNLKDSRKYL